MSGGHFDYKQYDLRWMADCVEQLIRENNTKDDYGYANNFSYETLEEFKKGLRYIKIAEVYLQRIDWLVSGDDGEETFHKRLKDDLVGIE